MVQRRFKMRFFQPHRAKPFDNLIRGMAAVLHWGVQSDKQTHMAKDVWIISNLPLYELQNKWLVRSQAAEKIVLSRGIVLAKQDKNVELQINMEFCVKIVSRKVIKAE
jgi:hypothetical protein